MTAPRPRWCPRHGWDLCTCGPWRLRPPANVLGLLVFAIVALLEGCTAAQHAAFVRALDAVVSIGARLAPAACAAAGGKASDCEAVRQVAAATDEARAALLESCDRDEAPDDGVDPCAKAATKAADRARELARELERAAPAAPRGSAVVAPENP